jgi:hypothetical protein
LNRAVTCLPRLPQHSPLRSPSLSPQRGTDTPRYLLSRHPHIPYNPACVLPRQTVVFLTCFASFSFLLFYLYPYPVTTSRVIGYFPTVLTKIGSHVTAKHQILNYPHHLYGIFLYLLHSHTLRETHAGPAEFRIPPTHVGRHVLYTQPVAIVACLIITRLLPLAVIRPATKFKGMRGNCDPSFA